jgi:hypothetical protein
VGDLGKAISLSFSNPNMRRLWKLGEKLHKSLIFGKCFIESRNFLCIPSNINRIY